MTTADKLKKLARKFANAKATLTWLGSMHPDEWDEVKEEYRNARTALYNAIEELCNSAHLMPFCITHGNWQHEQHCDCNRTELRPYLSK